jgi:hypothetical protein
MAPNDIVHVAIVPPDRLEVNLIRQVAAIVNKDLYRIRLLLSGRIPRIIDHYDKLQAAELNAQSLRALGLVAIVCKDSELRKPSQSFRAKTMKFDEKAVLFWDEDGQARRMESRDAFLIIKGRMQTYSETEVMRTTRKLNLPATLLTGGFPVWRKVEEIGKDKSVQDEIFLRIYERMSPEPGVEIFQYDCNYSFLGPEMTMSSLANFNNVVAKIRAVFPQAMLDNSLMKLSQVNVPTSTPQETIDINCKLICLYQQAMSTRARQHS